MAAVLSAGQVEARARLYTKGLIQRGILFAAALNSQTITFPATSNNTYGVALFTVNATVSSGLSFNLVSLTRSSLLVIATLCRRATP